MELSLQLYGYLILTVLGIVVPFFIILLSLFQEGISKLAEKYKKEEADSKESVEEQILKQKGAKEKNYDEIASSIKKLKKSQSKAKKRLSYLSPKIQISKLFIILLISFLGVIFNILKKVSILGVQVFTVISVILFLMAIYILWRLLCVLIEVKGIIDRDRNVKEDRILELLSTIAKKGEGYFLEKIYIEINDLTIDNNERELSLISDTQSVLELTIKNRETKMAKNLEAGFVFPHVFLIDESENYSYFKQRDGSQVVRYEQNILQGMTNLNLPSLNIKAIKEGEYTITTFIKAENVETTYRYIKIKVVKDEGSS